MAPEHRGRLNVSGVFEQGSKFFMLRRVLWAVPILCVWSDLGFAQGFEGARLLGMADAQRALTTGNDAIYVNPAGLALAKVYSVEVGYLDDIRGSDRRLNASIIDSQAGPIAGGLAYTWSKRRPDDVADGETRLEGHRTELSLATLLADSAGLGVTARYLSFDRNEGETKNDERSFDVFTLDAGLQWRIFDGLAVGVAGYNLTNSSRSELPIAWGAGLGYQFSILSLEADVRYNAQIGKARYSGGTAVLIADLAALRAGVSYDLANEAVAVSAGVGFVLDRFSVDAGYRQRVDHGEGRPEDGDERILGLALRLSIF